MAQALAGAGVRVDVATTDDDGPGRRVQGPVGGWVERDGFRVIQFRKQTEFYKVSLPFRRWVRRHARDYDLVHIHALFSFTSVVAARAARRAGVPYVVRPLGVLNRWGMENRRRRLKALSFRCLELPILRHAVAVHYTSRAEQREAEEVGVSAPALVIPLGIDLAPFTSLPGPDRFFERFSQARDRSVILFLSRIDPKKGLDLLLPAFAQVLSRFPRTLLVLAGSGDDRFVATLREEVSRLGLEADVLWAGFLTGADKLAAFSAATLFALPSHSENFGIALVEALAAGVPCLTTDSVAVSADLCDADAGVVVPRDMGAIADGMETLLRDPALRARISANGRRLAAERFSLEAMGAALAREYKTLGAGAGRDGAGKRR
jgi:glycosyltransferase involved in cell wall biosynthesis